MRQQDNHTNTSALSLTGWVPNRQCQSTEQMEEENWWGACFWFIWKMEVVVLVVNDIDVLSVYVLQDLDEVQSSDLYCTFLLRDYRGSKKDLQVSSYQQTCVLVLVSYKLCI